MNRNDLVVLYLLIGAVAPVFLAMSQEVPSGSVFKQLVLILSLAAFGLILGQFWLSKLLPWHEVHARPAVVIRWHKVVGYATVGFFLIHPILMIARRFWVQESDPLDNLLLMLRAPALLPAIVAWVLLVLLVVLALVRRGFSTKSWRIMHGLISSAFVAMAVWHVVAVGRHSNAAMSAYWIVLAAGAVGALLVSYRQSFQHARPASFSEIDGGAHEPA
jgi:predicted ferric reductase